MTTWLVLKEISGVKGIHGLASLYRWFVKNFSIIIAPITECMKKGTFEWTKVAYNAFEIIKQKLY